MFPLARLATTSYLISHDTSCVSVHGGGLGGCLNDVRHHGVTLRDLPHRASTALSNTQRLQRRLVCAERQSRVGDFPRVGNDPIQPSEKSASKLLICNDCICGASGLQIIDAMGAERRRARSEWNRALRGLPGRVAKSAGTCRNPRNSAVLRNKKGQPRAVDLYILVAGHGIERKSACKWFGQA
jgi:hypothetical protein